MVDPSNLDQYIGPLAGLYKTAIARGDRFNPLADPVYRDAFAAFKAQNPTAKPYAIYERLGILIARAAVNRPPEESRGTT